MDDRMATVPVTLSDLEGHFCWLSETFVIAVLRNIVCINYYMFTHESESGRKWGLLYPFPLGKLGHHLTQCGLGRGLPPYQVAS